MEEAKKVKTLLIEMPSIPAKAGEEYFIVAIDWWEKWKQYTFYNEVVVNEKIE